MDKGLEMSKTGVCRVHQMLLQWSRQDRVESGPGKDSGGRETRREMRDG